MDEFLCLANSRKLGGRCLAGYVEDRGWVRPVSSVSGGEVSLSKAKDIELLDLVEIDLRRPEPLASQPENFVFNPATFSTRTGMPSEVVALLESVLDPDPEVLKRGQPDQISTTAIQSTSISASLALIEPDSIQWSVTISLSGSRQTRCVFSLRGKAYDLVVTDTSVHSSLGEIGRGSHPRSAAGFSDDDRVLLTISLAEEFRNAHYKLVAAAIALPNA